MLSAAIASLPTTCRPPFSLVTCATVSDRAYPYTHDLLELHNISSHSSFIPPIKDICSIVSPFQPAAWESALQDHPDRLLCNYIATGLRQGFRIGYETSQARWSAPRNMTSARSSPGPVETYLQNEVTEGRLLSPLPKETAALVHISRFGVIPKHHQPGKWRLILDLSFPLGGSVNNGIAKDLCSLHYESVDDAAHIIMGLGRDAQLAKIDIAHAYHNVPVHPADRHLLGMQWDDKVYIDTALPFGLRSAPKIFCALSDMLEWILLQAGISSCLHYLDDFLAIGAPNSSECQQNLSVLLDTCSELGIPLAREKIEGPTSRLTFLGIELDARDMTMRVPQEKLAHLTNLIAELIPKRAATKRSVLSLIGELAHAAKVVSPGRTFLRRMINCARSRKKLDDWIRLNSGFRSDLHWWHLYLRQWNGVLLLAEHVYHPPDIELLTDASGSWGCGGTMGQDWFQCPWSKQWLGVNIATKELVPIVVAVAIWGPHWPSCHIHVRSDNMAVVAILKTRSSRDDCVMHLLRCLHFFCAKYGVRISATHIAGVENVAADALSRNNLQLFFLSCPKAQPQPTLVPQALWEVIVEEQPDWLSPDWRLKLSNY